ncbi:mucin-19-like isoform X7 [Mytilus edulis]|uniref:mucin-19-like isoform X7 n=1 Tax=Mytilus edulis TaxID=6550 RepID=UPI0039EFFF70
MEVITHKKIMKEWTSLIYLFCICGLISSINGQQFPVFGQGQQVQGQGNPAQFQQFLQTRQAAPGVGEGTAAGGTATGLTNSVRTVTVPILPAPPGTDLTQGATFTQFQRGATQTASSDGPIPRFTQGSAFLGRPFTQFGPNMRPFAQGQQMNAASMAAAQQRQAQMQQNAQLQARQQAGMAAQQAGMAASRTQFPGLGLGENGQMLVLTNQAVNNIRAGRNNIGRTNNLNGVRSTRPASSLLSVFALQPGVLNGAGVQGRSVQRNGQQGERAGVQQQTRTVVQRTNGAGRGSSIAVQRTNGMPRGTNGVNRRQAVTVRRTRLGQNSQQAMQRRMAQQQFMAQQQNGNAFMTGLAQRQQAAGQNQQGQQGAGTLWRPDVRMPGMMTPPGGAFPPRRFPGMFPPGFVNRNIARQNGAATGITGASNALNAPRAQQTQNRLTPPIMNPRDPRLGLMPVQANLQMFGSRQRPFPTPNVAATQTAMNRQNRMNTNAMAAAATNRINPNFPPVNSQFPGAVGGRTMPVNVGTPQGMARRPMPPNFGAFPGSGGRAMPSSVGAFPGSGGGVVPSNVGAFPGGQTNADMSANQIVPSNVDMFPGIGSSSSSTDGSTVTNELPGEISAFPGAESLSGSSASAATEFIGDIPAFPGAESIGDSSMTPDLPVFPGEEPGLTAGEIPPPPPVFPAKDINNIPASADAELFPPFDLGRGTTGSPFSVNIPPVPAGEMMGSQQDFGRVNSASTLGVTMVEPNSRTGIKPAASSFPGVNSADVTPPKTGIYQRGNGLVMAVLDLTNADKNNLGEMMQILQNLIDERNRNMAAPVMTEPTEAPTFSEFPSANFESSFPGSGTSSFGGASSSSFPGAGSDVASSFPGMGNAVESQKSSVSISGLEVPFVSSGFPGSEARSPVNSFPGSDFISARSANQATETPSGMASFPGSGSNMSGFPGMRTEKTSTFSPSKGVAPPGTVSGIEGFERTESDLSSSIGGVPIELWQR